MLGMVNIRLGDMPCASLHSFLLCTSSLLYLGAEDLLGERMAVRGTWEVGLVIF